MPAIIPAVRYKCTHYTYIPLEGGYKLFGARIRPAGFPKSKATAKALRRNVLLFLHGWARVVMVMFYPKAAAWLQFAKVFFRRFRRGVPGSGSGR